MPREFAITTPSPTVSLDPKGRGEIAFTVSNVIDAPMRARASLLPSGGLKPAWLSLRGSPLRDMPAGHTEVFIVDIQVPPGTPPGPYTFRLVVADNELPDERYSEGPAVSVEVGAPAPAPARGFPWWPIVLGVLLIGGGAVAAFFALRNGPPPECPEGQALCAGECTNLQADPQNCGQCGTTCGPDQVCQDGTCQCDEGLTRCGDACVNLQTQDENCGRCGNVCGEDFDCQGGQCVRTGCPGGQTLCGEQCVDTRTDEQNCGLCNKRCGANQVCRNGVCQCTGGLTACGNKCVDTRTDEQNCGRCGRRCGAKQVCQNGTCQCSQGLALCAGTCVNLSTNDKHCGRCGTACPAKSDCRAGKCVPIGLPTCGTGEVLCPCTRTCLPPALCVRRCDQDTRPL